MNSDNYGLQDALEMDFFSFPDQKCFFNARLSDDTFLLDFESIEPFLSLEPSKPLIQKSLQQPELRSSTDDDFILIESESEGNQFSNDLNMSSSITENLVYQPSPILSISTQASTESQKKQRSHSMNNMPGFLISAIHQRITHLKFQELDTLSLNNMIKVSKCFYLLIDVLVHIRSKVGNRKQLRMVFNDVDKRQIQKLHHRMNLAKAEEMYLHIIKHHTQQILNEAKQTLRTLLYQLMSQKWIVSYSETRQFTSSGKKEIFEKYLAYFRWELQEGNVKELVNRKQVLNMDPLQEGMGSVQKHFHQTSHLSFEEPKLFTDTSIRRFL